MGDRPNWQENKNFLWDRQTHSLELLKMDGKSTFKSIVCLCDEIVFALCSWIIFFFCVLFVFAFFRHFLSFPLTTKSLSNNKFCVGESFSAWLVQRERHLVRPRENSGIKRGFQILKEVVVAGAALLPHWFKWTSFQDNSFGLVWLLISRHLRRFSLPDWVKSIYNLW